MYKFGFIVSLEILVEKINLRITVRVLFLSLINLISIATYRKFKRVLSPLRLAGYPLKFGQLLKIDSIDVSDDFEQKNNFFGTILVLENLLKHKKKIIFLYKFKPTETTPQG